MFDLDVGRDDMIYCCTARAICGCSSYICSAFKNSMNLLGIICVDVVSPDILMRIEGNATTQDQSQERHGEV
jgi:hypothetical protein